jgi:hypothetical protein
MLDFFSRILHGVGAKQVVAMAAVAKRLWCRCPPMHKKRRIALLAKV